MKTKKTLSFIVLTGFLLNSLELILHIFNTSLCEKESCKIVTSHTRFGDEIFILGGIITFFLLFILLKKIQNQLNSILFDSILVVSLSMEGFLVGFQVFRLNTLCYFCLTVFFIFLATAIIRIVSGNFLSILGLISFIGVFSLMFFVLPTNTNFKIPDSKYTVIYSKNCPHCKNVIKFLTKNGLDFIKITSKESYNFLNSLRINEVPVLVEHNPHEVRIIIGEDKIIKHLKGEKEDKNKILLDEKNNTCKFGIPCDG